MKEYNKEEVQPGQANGNNKYSYASAAIPGELMIEIDIAYLLDNDSDYVCGFLGKAIDLDILKNESILFVTDNQIEVRVLFTGLEPTDVLSADNYNKLQDIGDVLHMKDKIHIFKIGY